MKSAQPTKPSGGFGVFDVLYILFKHKWKILLLTLLGLIGAGAIYQHFQKNPTYVTRAKLLIRYMVPADPVDSRGEPFDRNVMLTEVELIKSRDTAVEVAEAIGPQRLLPEAESSVTAADAAGSIMGGLDVRVPGGRGGSSLLFVDYRTPNSDIAVDVLNRTIDIYLKKHHELHHSIKDRELLQDEADRTYAELQKIESDISDIKERNNILSVEGSKEELENRRTIIRAARDQAQMLIGEREAKVTALEEARERLKASLTNVDPEVLKESEDAEMRERAYAMITYRDLQQRSNMIRNLRNEKLVRYPADHPSVRALDRQMSGILSEMRSLVDRYPEFGGFGGEDESPGSARLTAASLEEERAMLEATKARLKTIEAQADRLPVEVRELGEVEFRLSTLGRQRSVLEQKYLQYVKRLMTPWKENPSDVRNIEVVQSPTPPSKSIDEESMKIMAGVAASGLILGLAIAFLIEMVIDRRVSRPTEIETRLQLPLMLSIPYVKSKDGIAKLIGHEPGLERIGDGGDSVLPPIPDEGKQELATEEDDHFIAPYAAAIRDRILFNFEINNITHKPKLVGVSGLSEGAGGSTIAAGLARSFAETGDRKVLYVDLNPKEARGEALPDPSQSLKRALELSRDDSFRDSTRSLYFASAPTRRERGPGKYSLIPTKLHEMMPLLTASDYDYIIFDMPPVDPTSPTLAMGGFMDKMLLVLDANHTSREALRWGFSELEKGRADVSCIYNKARSHAPNWVQGAA